MWVQVARTVLLMAILCMGLVSGCAGPTRQALTLPGPHARVMTYNVNYGGPGADLAVEAIRESGADLVCLQETNGRWESLLRATLSEQYPHMLFRHEPMAGGMAVLSRQELREVAYVLPEGGWFPGWVLEAQTPAGPVQVVAVHLHPPLNERGSVSASAYFTTQDIRRGEIQAIWGHVQPGRPTLVMGDFNEPDNGAAVRYLQEQGLTDALRQFDRQTDTWRWRSGLVSLQSRYDHILYSRQLECYHAAVLNRGASDHLPVVAIVGPRSVAAGPPALQEDGR